MTAALNFPEPRANCCFVECVASEWNSTTWYAPHGAIMPLDSSKGEFPLKTLRKDLGLTQSGFAKLLGVETTTVGRWERRERDPQLSLTQVGILDRAAEKLQARLADYIEMPPTGETAEGT